VLYELRSPGTPLLAALIFAAAAVPDDVDPGVGDEYAGEPEGGAVLLPAAEADELAFIWN